jgi:two-component system chemotaxis response regulator CheB
MAGHDIVVVGASAGGVESLKELARQLPPDVPAAMFVVVHLPPRSFSMLAEIVDRSGPLPAVTPRDGDPIRAGRIHVGPPDHHLLLDRDRIRVVRGPRHDRHRPAIDPLFESASRAFGARVVGVVLSGTLDDGSAGLQTIRRRGGLAVVQDPDTALFRGMPARAIELVADAEVVGLNGMGDAIVRLVASTPGPEPAPEPELDRRFENYCGRKTDVNQAGKPSVFACPECSGVLWQVEDGPAVRFECRIGHSYTPQGLLTDHDDAVQRAIEAAMRALEENASLNRRIAQHMRGTRRVISAKLAERRAAESESHAGLIRAILNPDSEPPPPS